MGLFRSGYFRPMAILRVVFRFFLFVFGSLWYTFWALLPKLLGMDFKYSYRAYVAWKKLMIWGLNIKVELEGPKPTTAGVIMANHRSYVDVLFIDSETPVVFVAKKSVSKWPIVGWGGKALSTVWVERSSKTSRQKTREQLTQRLEEGISVVVFPEGTTHRGPETLAFKPGMFNTVASAQLPVYALAIEYENPKIAWVDDDLFLPHFFEIFGQKAIRVKLRFSQPLLHSDGTALKEQTQDWINQQLLVFRSEWDKQLQGH